MENLHVTVVAQAQRGPLLRILNLVLVSVNSELVLCALWVFFFDWGGFVLVNLKILLESVVLVEYPH